MADSEVNHYFSPRTTAGERFWIPVQTYAADGDARPNQGAFRFVSLALHILPTIGRKAPQERFSEERLRIYTHPETHYSPAVNFWHTHRTRKLTTYSKHG